NDESIRGITNRLYGGGSEHRLQQEMLLGMGGVKALRLYSRLTGAPEPDVYHANEGHAGFLGVERISDLVTNRGLTFGEAVCTVRAGSVFTTHTPVPAGIDRFGADLMKHYFGGDCELPGVPLERLLELGAESYEGGSGGIFNMAMLGLRLAQRANGVAKLHGVVSREMFNPLWPGFDAEEVPITSVTNGVHGPTWVDERVFSLTERFAGTDEPHVDQIPTVVEQVPTADIWSLKRELRAQLVAMVRQRMRESWLNRGASAAELGWTQSILSADALTIGFARRAATYKRLTLMLEDPDRFKRLLLDTDKPVQMIIAGKSHPADDMGKSLIQQMVKFTDDPAIRHRIAFLPNYDIGMARTLYPGCDVWLNNPLRPMEACGTSGMKAALNGGLNLSILDGWWDEWFDGENGWSIPTADGVFDIERRDTLEASALYDLIENNVVPRFYDRDADKIPQRWVAMMRHTLSTLAPKALASRMVQEYTRRLYTPAAQSGWAIKADDFAQARDLAAYEAQVRDQWRHVRVDHVESSGISASPQIGERLHVRGFVSLGTLKPEQVRVQTIYGHVAENDDLSDTVTEDLAFAESFEGGRHSFESELALRRTGSMGYSMRVVPKHPGLSNVAELGLVANA
ncbi:MAG: alpha-glucan family phosphorylase, partial [Micrococcales bacterium]|nr:alpha-glucan family phosphorylase [Micrococcales bacterium]